MNVRRWVMAVNLAGALVVGSSRVGTAQCCLNDLFAGFHSCFYRAPQAYAVAPVAAPMMAPAPIPAPIPLAAPPQPVVVPVQQVSYVPETTYRTEYRSVPVTSYKPSSEIDPCTGCPRDCMEQVTNYVQQPVNVPVTQYRAVYSTKYVQMQPQQGYAQPGYAPPMTGAPAVMPAAAAPVGSAWVPGTTVAPGPAAPASSPFAAPVQTNPQAWGAAGADISQQVLPGQTSINAPALPAGGVGQPLAPAGSVPPTYQQQIVPQSGTYSPQLQQAPGLQPTSPPALTPAPSLRPIPEVSKSPAAGQAGTTPGAAVTGAGTGAATNPAAGPSAPAPGTAPGTLSPATGAPATGAAAQLTAPRLVPIPALPATPATPRGPAGGMPTVPGPGPGTTTGAFPRLLAPTVHTTSWQPAGARPVSYPTAALPTRPQQ